jgi:surface antigen
MFRLRLAHLIAYGSLASSLAGCVVPDQRGQTREPTAEAATVPPRHDLLSAAADASDEGDHQATSGSAALRRGSSRVVADDTQVAQMVALWRAVTRSMVGQEIAWSNKSNGDHGNALIVREADIPDSDRVCREYREDGMLSGQVYRSAGQVCQQRDGTWAIISGGAPVVRQAPILETDRACSDRRQLGTSRAHAAGSSGQFCRQPDGNWTMVQG